MLMEGAVEYTGPAPVEDSDQTLVCAIQEGDVAAFDSLVLKYRARLFSVIYNITGHREDAADLTQDAFVQAFKSIGHFQKQSSFYTWLYRIGVNLALKHLRKHRLRQIFSFEKISEEAISSDFFDALSSRLGTERTVLLKELRRQLNGALHRLSPKHRTVVILFELEGLSHGEIAAVMGCSEGTVRSRLHYARQELKAYLRKYIGD